MEKSKNPPSSENKKSTPAQPRAKRAPAKKKQPLTAAERRQRLSDVFESLSAKLLTGNLDDRDATATAQALVRIDAEMTATEPPENKPDVIDLVAVRLEKKRRESQNANAATP